MTYAFSLCKFLGLAVLAAVLSCFIGCLAAAKMMHDALLYFSMRWPMNFFDTTPLGRILNRFSSDVQVIDVTLPHLMYSMINTFFSVILSLFLLPKVFVYCYYGKYFVSFSPSVFLS